MFHVPFLINLRKGFLITFNTKIILVVIGHIRKKTIPKKAKTNPILKYKYVQITNNIQFT